MRAARDHRPAHRLRRRRRVERPLEPVPNGGREGRERLHTGTVARGRVGVGPYNGAVATKAPDRIHFTGDDAADRLLAEDPFALLIGFALDQQVPVQKAFSAPLELERRIGTLDPGRIAAMDPADLDEAFRERPALHRFPGAMARRVQELAATSQSDTTATRPASGRRPPTRPTSRRASTSCRASAR